MHLVSVVFVNQPASYIFSGGNTLNFVLKPLEDKFFISGMCNDSCSKGPDATFSSLLLLNTIASYLYKLNNNNT